MRIGYRGKYLSVSFMCKPREAASAALGVLTCCVITFGLMFWLGAFGSYHGPAKCTVTSDSSMYCKSASHTRHIRVRNNGLSSFRRGDIVECEWEEHSWFESVFLGKGRDAFSECRPGIVI